MDNLLRELAKKHTLEAMKFETQQNQRFINTTPVYRNTYRTTKIEVLRAMVRNHILRQFVHLSAEDQTIQNLKKIKGISNEFEIFVSNISATSYAYELTYKAEQQLLLDYTNVNRRDTDYVLDQLLDTTLEEEHEIKGTTRFFSKMLNIIQKTINIIGLSISWLLAILYIMFIIGVFIGTIRNHEPNTLEADSTANTIVGNNSDNSMRSFDAQIEDDSTPSNFGNTGISGNDAINNNAVDNSADYTTTEKVEAPLSTTPYEVVKSDDYSFEEDTEDQTSSFIPVEESELVVTEVPEETFTIGSTKKQVKAVMGNPTSDLGSSWSYRYSFVQFDQDVKVKGWSNISDNLKVYMGEKNEYSTAFTIHSTHKDVVASMGTPTSITGDTWSYEYSMVNFDRNHLVKGWSNISRNLNVSLGSVQKNASPFTTHSSKQEVIHAMGTPTSIIGNTWSYEYSMIRFDENDAVISWSDISHNLKAESSN